MKNTLVVAADLGGFKAYRLDNGDTTRTPRLELIEEFHNKGAHQRLVDKVTDLSGRFPRGTGRPHGAAMSDGERHNIELEWRKRLVRQAARRLNVVLSRPDFDNCYFAAGREIHHSMFEQLAPAARNKISRSLSADLIKIDKSDLLRHFQPSTRPTPIALRPTAL